jgi:hypothetical protein
MGNLQGFDLNRRMVSQVPSKVDKNSMLQGSNGSEMLPVDRARLLEPFERTIIRSGAGQA